MYQLAEEFPECLMLNFTIKVQYVCFVSRELYRKAYSIDVLGYNKDDHKILRISNQDKTLMSSSLKNKFK